ncbi:CBS domain-containing protein [Terrimonas ferruginea]|uniref:CBS domain-containing protein n=1 Tax=Terrimonas ferruginea TaxID=249 RepID=UPI00042279E3|nr:CBS domain-containing protein [Terrimonas ferruginea]
MAHIPSKLLEIKKKVDAGESVEDVTVRTLLGWFWGSQRRGWFVVKSIRDALYELHLETIPDFSSAYIDSLIRFQNVHSITSNQVSEPIKMESDILREDLGANKNDEMLNFDDPTYRVSRLEAANKKLIAVKPDSDLSEAITLMMTFDFSQLPVMQTEKRDLKGVISWRSIGQKLAVGLHSRKVRDLMEPNYQLINSDTSLFKAIPSIIEHDYVLVRNSSNEICGIVTASDLSAQFKQLTEPFLLVAEIENHLRLLLTKLDKDELAKGKDDKDEERTISDVSDLTFGEYLRLCQNTLIWEKIGLPIDRVNFCAQLEKIRTIRNTIMHFDPDGLAETETEDLRSFVRLLQTIRNLGVVH